MRVRDQGWAASRRALKAAVVVPVNFAIGSQVIGSAPLATFAAFGSFALLLFTTFTGSRATRVGCYLMLAVSGAVLVTLGTLVARPSWLAVPAMALVAFGVLFAGVVSSSLNAGTQAALLAFILAVMLPGRPADLAARLGGWTLAAVVSIPVAVLVWPPTGQDELRSRAATLCRSIAAMLQLQPPPAGTGDRLVALRDAARSLRRAFRSSATQAAAISTGARLGIRLVDELEWLATIVTNACADAPEGWSPQGRRLRTVSAAAMAAAADALAGRGDAQQVLRDRLAELEQARRAVTDEAVRRLRATAGPVADGVPVGEFDRPLYSAHELGYAVDLCVRTVAAIEVANSRSWWQRLLGRPPSADDTAALAVTGLRPGPVRAAARARRVAAGHLDRHSVWLQNSIRGAVGLAMAVLLSRIFEVQNAFWIGLGALSVLRTNATATGATVVRALAGTTLGFAIGGAAVSVIGTNHAVLWTLLPVVIGVSALAPTVIPFIAGQAAFTVFSIVLFNIIAPAGWRIGVLRVEDVALGCLASLVAGVLFWPRGAAAALSSAFSEAYRSAAEYLASAVAGLTAPTGSAQGTASGDAAAQVGSMAASAGQRLDDALRQYLAEKGAKTVPLESVAALANGATRLRLAGMAIAGLPVAAPGGVVIADGDHRLDRPVDVLTRRAAEVTGWYTELADGFERGTDSPAVEPSGESFLDVVLPVVDGCGDAELAARAEQLLWSGQYLGDVNQLRSHLLPPAALVIGARRSPWWRR